MVIGFDGTRGINESAGIGRYCLNLMKELSKHCDAQSRFLFTAMRGKADKIAKIKNAIGSHPFVLKSIPGEWKNRIWGGPVSWPDKWIKDVDLWHATSIWEAPLSTKKPLVVTIHDMTPFLFPQLRGDKVSNNQKKRTLAVCRRADKIIAVSKATADDLGRIIPDAKNKTVVVPLGVENSFRVMPAVKKEKVILVVGTVEPRKNLPMLFKAFADLPVSIKDEYRIWVVGAKGWRDSDIFKSANALGDSIKFWGYVDDRQLVELYNKAEVFAFPSLYEGFGLPLLEAMACGAPIIANNISSIPEVVGDCALLINSSQKEWTLGLSRILADANLRRTLSLRGVARAKQFSWHMTVDKTIEVYKQLLKQ